MVSSFMVCIYDLCFSIKFGLLYFVIGITVITLVVGYWWFISGIGEKRLERIFQKMDNEKFLEGTFDPYIGHKY